MVSINSTNLQVAPGGFNTIAGHSVLIAYSRYTNGTGSSVEQYLRCSDVYLGNGTVNNFTYSNNGQQNSSTNGTITITTNAATHILIETLYLLPTVLVSVLLLFTL